jgi:hypothetical protein
LANDPRFPAAPVNIKSRNVACGYGYQLGRGKNDDIIDEPLMTSAVNDLGCQSAPKFIFGSERGSGLNAI